MYGCAALASFTEPLRLENMPSATIVSLAVEMREVPISSVQETPTMVASGVFRLRADSSEGATEEAGMEVEVEVEEEEGDGLKLPEWDKIADTDSVFMMGSPSLSKPETMGRVLFIEEADTEGAGVLLLAVVIVASLEDEIFFNSASVSSFFALPIRGVTEGVFAAIFRSCCTNR